MELDTIVYIIITISIFMVGLLGQSKKKKIEKPELDDKVEYSLNDFEKILLRKEEFQNTEKDNLQNEINEARLEENDLTEKKTEPQTKSPFKAAEKETDDGFDIKSAIIYSSILERKKFRR